MSGRVHMCMCVHVYACFYFMCAVYTCVYICWLDVLVIMNVCVCVHCVSVCVCVDVSWYVSVFFMSMYTCGCMCYVILCGRISICTHARI